MPDADDALQEGGGAEAVGDAGAADGNRLRRTTTAASVA
jgi:hypothetical protein